MLEFQLIEKALLQDRRFPMQESKFLQVGPDDNTLEICLNKVEGLSGRPPSVRQNRNTFFDCHDCPYRLSCKKGKRIINGNLCYDSTFFHKIILLANASLLGENCISSIVSFLPPFGSLVLFVCKEEDKKPLNDFSFALSDIRSKINLNELEIQSITNMRVDKEDIMCLIVSKR